MLINQLWAFWPAKYKNHVENSSSRSCECDPVSQSQAFLGGCLDGKSACGAWGEPKSYFAMFKNTVEILFRPLRIVFIALTSL